MSELNLSTRTVALAASLATSMSVAEHAKDAVSIKLEMPKELYNDNLPEGITPKVVKELTEYNKDFVAATTKVAGEKAVEAMAANKGIVTASVETPLGNDTLKAVFARHKSGPIAMGEKKGSTWNSYCHPTVTIKAKAAAKGSQLGRVFAHLKTEGEAKLK